MQIDPCTQRSLISAIVVRCFYSIVHVPSLPMSKQSNLCTYIYVHDTSCSINAELFIQMMSEIPYGILTLILRLYSIPDIIFTSGGTEVCMAFFLSCHSNDRKTTKTICYNMYIYMRISRSPVTATWIYLCAQCIATCNKVVRFLHFGGKDFDYAGRLGECSFSFVANARVLSEK